jgi:hypothetical protein
METSAVAETEKKAVDPIAFVNALIELREWAECQNIACPDPALPNSNTDADESWWLYDGKPGAVIRSECPWGQ